jgi:hypothetical protein
MFSFCSHVNFDLRGGLAAGLARIARSKSIMMQYWRFETVDDPAGTAKNNDG